MDILPTRGHTETGSNPVCSTKKEAYFIGFAGLVPLLGCQFGAIRVKIVGRFIHTRKINPKEKPPA